MKLTFEKVVDSVKRAALTSILVGALFAGSLTACAKSAPTTQVAQATQVSRNNISIDEVIKKSPGNILISMYGNPRGEFIAMYVLASKNSYGKELHNVSADLYLLHLPTSEHMRLSYKFARNVAPGSDIQPYWTLTGNSKSKFESKLREDMLKGLIISNTPLEMVLVSSDEGIFEVKPGKRSVLLYNEDTGKFTVYDRTVSPDLYGFFKRAKVPVPER